MDLFFASPSVPLPAYVPATVGAAEFFRHGANWRIFIDLTIIGVFGGWFIVPLYAKKNLPLPEKQYINNVLMVHTVISIAVYIIYFALNPLV